MANVTDPQSVGFSNNFVRPAADNLCKAVHLIDGLLALYSSKGMATSIPNDATAEIVDGARADGRTVIYGADVSQFIADIQGIRASITQAMLGRALKIAVNPQ